MGKLDAYATLFRWKRPLKLYFENKIWYNNVKNIFGTGMSRS
jgi:hypothetical protein